MIILLKRFFKKAEKGFGRNIKRITFAELSPEKSFRKLRGMD
jgi:hypothetical protein